MKQIFSICLIIFGIILYGSNYTYAKDAGTIVSIDINSWMAKFNADLKITDNSVLGTKLIGTTLDVIDDLGVDDSDAIPYISATVNILRSHRLVVSYLHAKNSGQKSITRSFDYKGFSYAAGADVSSKLDVTLFEGYYEWMLLKEDFVELGFLGGAKYAQIDSELTDRILGIETIRSESIDGPVPIIGVQGEVKFPAKVSLGAILKGFTINVSDLDFTLLDFQGMVNYDINRFFRASLGYKYMLVDATDDENTAKITYTGPFIGITGSF